MRLQYAAVSLLFALSCAEQLGARPGLKPRQNDVATTTSDNTVTSSNTNADSTATSSDQPTTTSSRIARTTSAASSGDGDATVPITLSETGAPTGTINMTLPTSTGDPNELPIQPSITPGLGVAGAILIVAGLILCFVGIKHRPTQTFISTSMLIALGIEVLIIYLMKPPVPDAVQGAYVVAGVVGGCLLGALALIFKEVSEGFGCVLGGFCLAMWLLVLSPGGLIQNSVGRIILIGLFCAAGFCLYVSRFTRVYGIIGCTSFAGAYSFILGIDCFSRAGLKEFWLYIWDLNPDVFPLFTDTYPINRDMRAETAIIIIVAFLGTMSQIKIWKIVKEQKAKRDADRLAEQELRDAEEAELGRDIEEQVARDRSAWESDYDGKKRPRVNVNGGMDSMDSRRESKVDSFDFSTPKVDSDKRHSYPMLNLPPMGYEAGPSTSKNRSTGSLAHLSTDWKRASAAPSLPPLSFGEDAPYRTGANASTTSMTEPGTPGLGIRNISSTSLGTAASRDATRVKRLSMLSLIEKDTMDAKFEEAPMEEELASSIAATAAEDPDLDGLSAVITKDYFSVAGSNTPGHAHDEFIEDDDDEALATQRRPSQTSRTPGSTPGEGEELVEPYEQTDLKDRLPTRMSKAAANHRVNEWAKEVSRAEPVPIEEVPEPDLEAVQVEMGNAADFARADENNAGPVVEAAPLPAPLAPPKKEVRASKQLARPPSAVAPTPVYSHSSTKSDADWSAPLGHRISSSPMLNVQTVPSPTPTPAPAAVLESVSEERPRNVSAPLLEQQRQVESPQTFSPRQSNRISQMPSRSMSNLLDERKDRMEKRLTTTSFMVPNAISSVQATSSSDEGGNKTDASQGGEQSTATSMSDNQIGRISEVDEEDMTLAERKALVQRQSSLALQNASLAQTPLNIRQLSASPLPTDPSYQLQQRPMSPTMMQPARLSSAGPKQPIYDSHQPRRRESGHNSTKQAINWSQWRSSNAIVAGSRNTYINADSQMDMLRHAHMQSEHEARIREMEKKAIQDQLDQHMRMGGMHDAHKRALAKMQGQVKD